MNDYKVGRGFGITAGIVCGIGFTAIAALLSYGLGLGSTGKIIVHTIALTCSVIGSTVTSYMLRNGDGFAHGFSDHLNYSMLPTALLTYAAALAL
jgi:hypothetical protein